MKPKISFLSDVDLAAPHTAREEGQSNRTSEEVIQDKIVETIDILTNTVIVNIQRLRIQLDSLEAAMNSSSKSTKEALIHHIEIGAKTLKAAQQIESEIESFSKTVQYTTPNSPTDSKTESTKAADRDTPPERTI